MIRTGLAKILTAKAAAVVAATTIGGVAVAAGTGHLPATHEHEASSQSQAQTAEASESGTESNKPASPKVRTHGSAAPSPSMVGLCRAYANVVDSHGKALDNPAFTALVTATGSKDKVKVTAWCTTLLAKQKAQHPAPADSPSQPSNGHPNAGQHPGAPPAEHRSGAPGPHPTPTGTPTPHAP